MIQRLSTEDTKKILDFAYKRERENLFIIGSFTRYKDPFQDNHFFGFSSGSELIGIAVHFGRWQSLTINVDDSRGKVIDKLVDRIVEEGLEIKHIPVFETYATAMIERLKMHHNRVPHEVRFETVYVLNQKDFHDFSDGSEARAMPEDLDEIILFDRIIEGENIKKPITENERLRFDPSLEFLVRVDGAIVSKANIHGISKNYFQIGGVGTLPAHRWKGYAKRAVSSLCRHYFNEGIKHALLFTDNTNFAAQKVYKELGFKAADRFIIARY